MPAQTDSELLGPLAPVSTTLAPVEATPARSTSEEALAPWTEAPPSLSQAEADLPAQTRLYAGETLVDRPTEAKRLGGERAEPGRVYVTSCRLIWEPTSTSSGGLMRGAGGTAGGGAIVLALHAIDGFRKPKGGSAGAGGPRDLDELSGGVPDVERSASGSSSSKLRQFTGRSSKSNAVVEAELYLKWGSWPALRLQLDDEASRRLHKVLNSATLAVPTRPSDLRADLRRCLAVAYAASVREAGGDGAARCSPWALYDADAEFHRQGLLNPLSHWRVSRSNEHYELCSTYPRCAPRHRARRGRAAAHTMISCAATPRPLLSSWRE